MTETVERQQAERQRARKEPGRHSAEREAAGQPGAARRPSRAKEKLSRAPRVAIGLGLLFFTAIVLANLTWAWSIASRLVPDSTGATPPSIRVHWLGIAFTPTLTFILLLIVALSALAGSTAATALVFSNRAGHDQLERYWVWWYLLRPGVAAVVAVVAYVSVKSGFLGTIDETRVKGLAFAAALGGLTGLFTDKMLEKLQKALGLSTFSESATGGSAPPPPSDTTAAPPTDTESTAPNGEADTTLTIPDAFEPGTSTEGAAPIPAQRTMTLEPEPEQTDNRPIPEDGEQDVDQETTPVPGSPTGYHDA